LADDSADPTGTWKWSVTRNSKYKGKVSRETIKGTIEFERDGQTQSRDWEAKREKR
jgi:hypothetical protein